MLTLVNTVRIFSEDIQMNFGFDKCAVLVINRGRATETDDIVLPKGTIEALPLSFSYKYVLRCTRSSDFQHKKVKSTIIATCKQRLRAILNGHNQIAAINGFAISVVCYTAGIIHWTMNDCLNLDRMTRKQMILHKALHPRADFDQLYVPQEKGGRGLFSVSDAVQVEMSALATYVECHELSRIYLRMRTILQPRLLWWISISLSGTLKHCMASGLDYYLREVFNLLLGLERHILTLLQRH